MLSSDIFSTIGDHNLSQKARQVGLPALIRSRLPARSAFSILSPSIPALALVLIRVYSCSFAVQVSNLRNFPLAAIGIDHIFYS